MSSNFDVRIALLEASRKSNPGSPQRLFRLHPLFEIRGINEHAHTDQCLQIHLGSSENLATTALPKLGSD